MKTVLTHFYNEEYLLPWWLTHHKKYFNHGILVNQNSTDNSVEICKKICPNWELIESRNADFDSCGTDVEMQELEANLKGWRITLCLTEFLVGNYNFLDECQEDQHQLASFTMIDNLEESCKKPTYNDHLINQKYFGSKNGCLRPSRSIHRKPIEYRFGRHFLDVTTDQLVIFWYGWSPWTEEFIKRKLQIQYRIPEIDKARGFGGHHLKTPENLQNTYIDILKSHGLENFKETYALAWS